MKILTASYKPLVRLKHYLGNAPKAMLAVAIIGVGCLIAAVFLTVHTRTRVQTEVKAAKTSVANTESNRTQSASTTTGSQQSPSGPTTGSANTAAATPKTSTATNNTAPRGTNASGSATGSTDTTATTPKPPTPMPTPPTPPPMSISFSYASCTVTVVATPGFTALIGSHSADNKAGGADELPVLASGVVTHIFGGQPDWIAFVDIKSTTGEVVSSKSTPHTAACPPYWE